MAAAAQKEPVKLKTVVVTALFFSLEMTLIVERRWKESMQENVSKTQFFVVA